MVHFWNSVVIISKTHAIITTQKQDEAENSSHVYSKIITLNEKKDDDHYQTSRNVQVFNHVVKMSVIFKMFDSLNALHRKKILIAS